MSTIDIYVPRDSGALSLGAEKVAAAIAAEAKKRNIDVRIIRNGSRGMYWLEPLVEVVTPAVAWPTAPSPSKMFRACSTRVSTPAASTP